MTLIQLIQCDISDALVTVALAPFFRAQTAENGKPLADARGEVAYSASFMDW